MDYDRIFDFLNDWIKEGIRRNFDEVAFDNTSATLARGKSLAAPAAKIARYERNRTVKGIVLHSTAYHGKLNDLQVTRNIGAHFAVRANGTIMVNYETDKHRESSNSLNRTTVAVEFLGNFRHKTGNWRDIHKNNDQGVQLTYQAARTDFGNKSARATANHDPLPVWVDYDDEAPGARRPGRLKNRVRHLHDGIPHYSRLSDPEHDHHDEITPHQIMSGRKLLMYLKQEIGISEVWGHVQSTVANKPDCPGHDVWYFIGEWAVKSGLLALGNNGAIHRATTNNHNGPIPAQWRVAPALTPGDSRMPYVLL